MVAGNDGSECSGIGFRKLRLDESRDLFRGMGGNVIHSFLQGIGKCLDQFGVCLYITLFGTECRVGDVAGFLAQGSDYIAVPLLLQRGGMGLKFYCVINLLLQFFEKIKSAYAVSFFINLYIFDCAFPEGLFMSFIEIKV